MSLLLNILKAPFALKKPEEKDGRVLLRAALFSDTHITKARYRRLLFIPGLRRVSRFAPDLVLFAGDQTDNGSEPNWAAFAAEVEKHCRVQERLIALGNHDTWESYAVPHDYAPARDRYLRYAGRLSGHTPETVWFRREFRGAPFFVLGSESDGVGSALGEAQLHWLEKALQAEAEKRPHGPFFVVHHSPMNHTHGVGENEHGMGIEGDASPRLQAILDRYENVFYICGHLHFGLQTGGERATVQRVGTHITSVCLPCYEYGEIFNGKYASPGFPLIGTGVLADVYEDKVVFTGASFLRGKEIGTFRQTVRFTAGTEEKPAAQK